MLFFIFVPKKQNAGSTYDKACSIPECIPAAPCYDNSLFGCLNGEFVALECQQVSSFCNTCFPYSRCGAFEDNSDEFIGSDDLVAIDMCGVVFAGCEDAAPCFDHRGGICAVDGEMLIQDCARAAALCKPCFPNSRCGSTSTSGDPADTMGNSTDEKSVESTAPINSTDAPRSSTGIAKDDALFFIMIAATQLSLFFLA